MLHHVREIWVGLAGVPVAFPAGGGIEVVVSAHSLLSPPGWVGIVVLGDAAIATVPAESTLHLVRDALEKLPLAALNDPDRLRTAIAPVTDIMGPATLAYLDKRDFQPVAAGGAARISQDADALADLLAAVPVDDAEESGLAEITSPAFVVRDGERIVAAAGYRHWPGQVAHICVLTAVQQRGRGLARAVASAAIADAMTHGLLPQWRARPEASRRVARALRFRQLGIQLCLRLAT